MPADRPANGYDPVVLNVFKTVSEDLADQDKAIALAIRTAAALRGAFTVTKKRKANSR